MLDTPVIVQTTTQLTAIIPIKVARSEMQKVMGPGINEVIAAVKAQGIGPTGPWFTHHLRITAEEFDFEICVPVSAPVTPVGRVKQGQWPAMKVARAIYSGPYEGLGAAWAELGAWITANGFSPATDLWERYISGPESNADAATYRTELNRELLD
ncbi:AraC family transcriptional regulator [Pseudolysobacter antarcticus]|uniref:AraC family transcriptional regulator n=1 Tax=Pseudolysobacter antarcticus TaxID=2511995 RepID=A0A411HJG8_9GAMM|nr:GyrI-like domain-containing protein [Pseudolysobacter antarcticus]QBB70554.1 AraC family transcriptional regulator [Pseudolysobacter antarcticus]